MQCTLSFQWAQSIIPTLCTRFSATLQKLWWELHTWCKWTSLENVITPVVWTQKRVEWTGNEWRSLVSGVQFECESLIHSIRYTCITYNSDVWTWFRTRRSSIEFNCCRSRGITFRSLSLAALYTTALLLLTKDTNSCIDTWVRWPIHWSTSVILVHPSGN